MIFLVFAFIFGLIIGSFLNVVIYRLPAHVSIVSPPSRCPSCGTRIKPYDNVPVLSYLLLRGRCRCCGWNIPQRYPFVELLTGLVSLGLYARYGLTAGLAAADLLAFSLVAVAFIDIDHGIIPDRITYPGIVLGIASSFFAGINTPLGALAGIIAGAGILFATAFIYKAVTGVEGMGMGDVKLMAMIGAFLGWEASLFVIVLSALLGSIAGLSLMAFAGKGRRYAIPYGPFISAAAVAYLFYGRVIIDLYMRVIGHA